MVNFRELRRSGVKRWICCIGADEYETPTEAIRSKLSEDDCDILSSAGFRVDEVDVLDYVERQGCTYRSGKLQVVLYGDPAGQQHFGLLKLIVKKKSTDNYLMVVHDQSVELVGHLGLHKLVHEGLVTNLIKFEHLTTSEPLNLYTSTDWNKEPFHYVTLKEALFLQ
jgi:hypothetical protein